MAQRKLLIVHYWFPENSASVIQFLGYAKALRERGWESVFLTGGKASTGTEAEIEAESFEIHRIPMQPHRSRMIEFHEAVKRAKGPFLIPLRKALSTIAPFYAKPDEYYGWAKVAVEAAAKIVRDSNIEAILGSCPPETNHVVASEISRRHSIPWIPYFGDLYGFYTGPRDWHKKDYHRFMARLRRRRWLKHSQPFLASTPAMVEHLQKNYGIQGSICSVGFDHLSETQPSRTEKFILSHIGSLYPVQQNPEMFLKGVDLFLRKHREAESQTELRFVGSRQDDWLRDISKPYAWGKSIIRILPKVKPAQALEEQKKSSALFAFNVLPLEEGKTFSFPSKIFEYLASRRPFLLIPPDLDWTDQIVRQTHGGELASTAEEIASVIDEWYAEWKDTGFVKWNGKLEEVEKFSRKRQTDILVAALEDASAPKQ